MSRRALIDKALDDLRNRDGCDDGYSGIGGLVDQGLQILGGDVDVDINVAIMSVQLQRVSP